MDRPQALDRLEQPWDLIVVGGGINGAGVLLAAARQGLKCLLLEQRDFAWGTSSRSGKMVHGGLRYLRQGQVKICWQSVRTRQRLLRQYPGLVEPMGFLFPIPKAKPWARYVMGLGLSIYELMAGRAAGKVRHRFHLRPDFSLLAPGLPAGKLLGGYSYPDAITDDARLVLRVLADARAAGAEAVNYLQVRDLIRGPRGQVSGVVAQEKDSGQVFELAARIVVNASGAWSDLLRARLGHPGRLRRLRGSHLLFPHWRLPLGQASVLFHPGDNRALYILPWEGATLLGTTDLEEKADPNQEPGLTPQEGAYLLEAANYWFPGLDLGPGDVISSLAGVRPVVASGRKDPDKEPRDHAIWNEQGLLTVTGGKLTTFPLVADMALKALRSHLGQSSRKGQDARPATPPAPPPAGAGLSPGLQRRLAGRYGPELDQVLAVIQDQQPAAGAEPVAETGFLWAELAWAAQAEMVLHLEDLLLRRTRLGLLLPHGGAGLLEQVRAVVQPLLRWDDQRWQKEAAAYRKVWDRAYSPALLGPDKEAMTAGEDR